MHETSPDLNSTLTEILESGIEKFELPGLVIAS